MVDKLRENIKHQRTKTCDWSSRIKRKRKTQFGRAGETRRKADANQKTIENLQKRSQNDVEHFETKSKRNKKKLFRIINIVSYKTTHMYDAMTALNMPIMMMVFGTLI